MSLLLESAGVRVGVESRALGWAEELIAEACAGEDRPGDAAGADVRIVVERAREAFDVTGWEPLTRGAWTRGGEVVVRDACTSGFDLHLRTTADQAVLTYRWRPPSTTRAAALLLRSRFRLLARAVLVQYPALWWSGSRERVPLHASACTVGARTVLLAGPGGVGKTTLLAAEVAAGGVATADNICTSDGMALWGLVEPLRREGGRGRRTTHGRREERLAGRAASLVPDQLVVLRRGGADSGSVTRCTVAEAARALTAGTYMAGELRRYWAFAATLSLGSGVGPAHPPVGEVAEHLAGRMQCFEVVLPRTPGSRLSELMNQTVPLLCA